MEEDAVVQVEHVNPLIDAVWVTGNTHPHFVSLLYKGFVDSMCTDL
jgi:hypothetical protein